MHMERLVKTFSFRVLSSNESSADEQRNATDNLIKEYGAQNEAYRMMEGRKVGKVVSLQRVMRSLTVEAPQNETFTLV